MFTYVDTYVYKSMHDQCINNVYINIFRKKLKLRLKFRQILIDFVKSPTTGHCGDGVFYMILFTMSTSYDANVKANFLEPELAVDRERSCKMGRFVDNVVTLLNSPTKESFISFISVIYIYMVHIYIYVSICINFVYIKYVSIYIYVYIYVSIQNMVHIYIIYITYIHIYITYICNIYIYYTIRCMSQ